MKTTRRGFASMAMLALTTMLTACGGGDSDGPSPPEPAPTMVTLKGFAYAGDAMSGATITVRTAATTQVAAAAADGSYSVTLPAASDYRLRAESTDRSVVAYSYAPSAASGVIQVNVNPMTTAILYNATKINPPDFFVGDRPLTAAELVSSELQVQRVLGRTLLQNGVLPDGSKSFFSSTFAANHQGLDGVLDAVRVVVSSRGVIVLPSEGLPIDLQSDATPFTATADQARTATIWAKVADAVKPSAKDAFDAADKAVDVMATAQDVHIYQAGGTTAYVFNGVARSLLLGKLIDAMKAGVLDQLSSRGAITADEEAFLKTLDQATFGAFFLTPYLNLASGKTATDGLELKIVEQFNKTRPGQWLLDPQQAAKDARPVVKWLAACQLPTRIFEGLLGWFSSNAGSNCAVANDAPTIAMSASPDPFTEGQVVRLDASGTTDPDAGSLSYQWSAAIAGGTGTLVVVDGTRSVAYLMAHAVSPGAQIDVTVSVTDSAGALASRTLRLGFGSQPLCAAPQVASGGACVTPAAPTVSLVARPLALTSGAPVVLDWASTNATTCTARGDWSGTRAPSGTASLSARSGIRNYELSCTGPGGTASASTSADVPVPTVTPTVSFTADPPRIALGASTTLHWRAVNADRCASSGAWTGSRAASGTAVVTPTATNYVYTLTCTSSTGSTTTTAGLLVDGAIQPPTVSLAATPPRITTAGSATLQWSTTDATSCVATGAWSGARPTSGSQAVSPTFGIHHYTLTCTGPTGTTAATTTLTVDQPLPGPIVSVTVAPAAINAGGSALLQWSSSNATSCTASGAWTGVQATSGTAAVSPAAGNHGYTLSCTGPGGSASSMAELVVTAVTPLPAINLTASPAGIAAGQSATLQWSTSNATTCTASGAWSGARLPSGTLTVTPAVGSHAYGLRCTGAGGATQVTATVDVSDCPAGQSLQGAVCVATPVGALPGTGVTPSQCYSAGSDALGSCAAAGPQGLSGAGKQDGMRFSALSYAAVARAGLGNHDITECVRDQITGLVWEGKPNDNSARGAANTYTNFGDGRAGDASAYVTAVNATALCGFTDWRLPTVKELHTLIDYARQRDPFDSIPMVDTSWFPNQAGYHTSADRYATASSWRVDLTTGKSGGSSMVGVDRVMLVRGAMLYESAGRYATSPDGSEITDQTTGLTWKRCVEGMAWNGSTCTGSSTQFTHEQALQAARTQAAWRVPNVKELRTLVQRNRVPNAVDATAFPASASGEYWSATPAVGTPSKAYVVSFRFDYVDTFDRTQSARLRLVRHN